MEYLIFGIIGAFLLLINHYHWRRSKILEEGIEDEKRISSALSQNLIDKDHEISSLKFEAKALSIVEKRDRKIKRLTAAGLLDIYLGMISEDKRLRKEKNGDGSKTEERPEGESDGKTERVTSSEQGGN